MSKKSRRNFLKSSTVLGAGFFIIPRNVLGGIGFTPPSDQLNIASIGSGGKGSDIQNSWASKERVIALCDVHPNGNHGVIQTRKKYPKVDGPHFRHQNIDDQIDELLKKCEKLKTPIRANRAVF